MFISRLVAYSCMFVVYYIVEIDLMLLPASSTSFPISSDGREYFKFAQTVRVGCRHCCLLSGRWWELKSSAKQLGKQSNKFYNRTANWQSSSFGSSHFFNVFSLSPLSGSASLLIFGCVVLFVLDHK